MDKKFIAVRAMAAVLTACATLSAVADEAGTKVLTIGSPAPSIDVEHWVSNGQGKFQPVKKFEAGKVYVVEFWATWCGPCISSMPHLAETQNKYADKGVQIISISDEDLETVEGFLKKPVRGAKPVGDDGMPPTYAELTSAYCLTTDPDGSVQEDYMRAAGQNGIPTCFIVGKDAHVEWIGHPMAMDEPLEQIVSGSWDRAAFMAEFKKEQERGLMMSKISSKMRRGDTAGALEVIAEAKLAAEGDVGLLAMLGQMEFQVKASSAMSMIQQGKQAEGLAELDEVAKLATPAQKLQITSLRFRILVEIKSWDDAARTLADLGENKEVDPAMVNQMAWQVYEMSAEDKEFSAVLIDAATGAISKAVQKAPTDGMILDTYAHLLYRQGKLDQAIEVQSKAVENLNGAPDDVAAEMKEFLATLKKEKAEE